MAILAVLFYALGYPTFCWITAIISGLWEAHRVLSWWQEYKRGFYRIDNRLKHINERW